MLLRSWGYGNNSIAKPTSGRKLLKVEVLRPVRVESSFVVPGDDDLLAGSASVEAHTLPSGARVLMIDLTGRAPRATARSAPQGDPFVQVKIVQTGDRLSEIPPALRFPMPPDLRTKDTRDLNAEMEAYYLRLDDGRWVLVYRKALSYTRRLGPGITPPQGARVKGGRMKVRLVGATAEQLQSDRIIHLVEPLMVGHDNERYKPAGWVLNWECVSGMTEGQDLEQMPMKRGFDRVFARLGLPTDGEGNNCVTDFGVFSIPLVPPVGHWDHEAVRPIASMRAIPWDQWDARLAEIEGSMPLECVPLICAGTESFPFRRDNNSALAEHGFRPDEHGHNCLTNYDGIVIPLVRPVGRWNLEILRPIAGMRAVPWQQWSERLEQIDGLSAEDAERLLCTGVTEFPLNRDYSAALEQLGFKPDRDGHNCLTNYDDVFIPFDPPEDHWHNSVFEPIRGLRSFPYSGWGAVIDYLEGELVSDIVPDARALELLGDIEVAEGKRKGCGRKPGQGGQPLLGECYKGPRVRTEPVGRYIIFHCERNGHRFWIVDSLLYGYALYVFTSEEKAREFATGDSETRIEARRHSSRLKPKINHDDGWEDVLESRILTPNFGALQTN